MKHLKIYENYKDKMKSKNKFNDMINNYIPGFYMIYKSNIYHWKYGKMNNYLALCRILEPTEFDDGIRLKIDIISYVCEIDEIDLKNSERINIGIKYLNINSDTFERVFLSSSLKTAQDKFEELKKTTCYQWELNNMTNKFNI